MSFHSQTCLPTDIDSAEVFLELNHPDLQQCSNDLNRPIDAIKTDNSKPFRTLKILYSKQSSS